MPNFAFTVSDPVSAIVVSALDFLTAAIGTKVGQDILAEVNAEVVNLIKFVHSRLPSLPTPTKAA